jgi:hypothetical protein
MTNRLPLRPVLFALSAAALAACADDGLLDPNPNDAIVTFAFEGHPADTLRVIVQDSATVAAAVSYLQTKTGPRMLIGKIARGSGVDGRYPFHFDATTVRLADMATEVCDGAPMRTTAEVTEFFALSTGSDTSTTATWCPWSSYPVKVER